VRRSTALALAGLGGLALLAISRQAAAGGLYTYPDGAVEYEPPLTPAPELPPLLSWPTSAPQQAPTEPAVYYDPFTGQLLEWGQAPQAPAPDEPAGEPYAYTDEEGNTFYYDAAGNYVGYSDPEGAFWPTEETYPETQPGEVEPVPEPSAPGAPMPAPEAGPMPLDLTGNLAAFLAVIRQYESAGDYSATYAHAIVADTSPGSMHPADPALGAARWPGVRLPDDWCAKVNLPPGCVSTAAGAYQFIYPTWRRLGQPDFTPESQDAAAVELLRRLGAYDYILTGQIDAAFRAASALGGWASLPYSPSGQPKQTLAAALALFEANGGAIAA